MMMNISRLKWQSKLKKVSLSFDVGIKKQHNFKLIKMVGISSKKKLLINFYAVWNLQKVIKDCNDISDLTMLRT